jgi:hypothetical protein
MTMIIDGTNGITFPDTSRQYNSYYNFKNRIINGAMVIDQRNNGASVTPTNGQYLVDRWQGINSQTAKFTVQRNAGSVTPPTGFSNYLGVTSSSAYSVVSGDYFSVAQIIEGFNTFDLNWGTALAQTVTLSFWVRSSLTGTFSISVRNAGSYNRSYPATYTINAANTWEYKTITIPGDTAGTWAGATNAGSLDISWNLGAGSTFSGTANTWQAGNLTGATGATSVVGTNGATFYITGVQLEEGIVSTPFDYRPFGTELALCQRYFEILTNDSNGYSILSSPLVSTANSWATWRLKQTKRASPTVALFTGNSWLSATPTISPSIDNVTFNGTSHFYNQGAAGGVGITAAAEL